MHHLTTASSRDEIYTGGPAWSAAAEAGDDMSLIITNLRQSVWERLQNHQSALDFALTVRAAGDKCMQDLNKLLGRLIEHHSEFVVVGGFAATAHAILEATQPPFS